VLQVGAGSPWARCVDSLRPPLLVVLRACAFCWWVGLGVWRLTLFASCARWQDRTRRCSGATAWGRWLSRGWKALLHPLPPARAKCLGTSHACTGAHPHARAHIHT